MRVICPRSRSATYVVSVVLSVTTKERRTPPPNLQRLQLVPHAHASYTGDRWDTRAAGRGCTRRERAPHAPVRPWARWLRRRWLRKRQPSERRERRPHASLRNRSSGRGGTRKPDR